MKKRFLLALIGGVLASSQSFAYTAEDLLSPNGGDGWANAIENVYGNYKQRSLHDSSSGMIEITGYITNTGELDPSYLKVAGMMNGNLIIELTINQATNTVKLGDNQTGQQIFPLLRNLYDNNDQLIYDGKPATGDDYDNLVEGAKYVRITACSVDEFGNYTDYPNRTWTGTITKMGEQYQIDFPAVKIEFGKMTGYYGTTFSPIKDPLYYNFYSLIIPKYNGAAVDVYRNPSGVLQYRNVYALNVKMQDDSKFSLLNMACRGFSINNYYDPFTDPYYFSTLGFIDGEFDWDNNKVTIYGNQQFMSDLTSVPVNDKIYSYRLMPLGSDGYIHTSDMGKPIYGEIKSRTPLQHEGETLWEKDCGGDLVTYEDVLFTLDPYVQYNVNKNSYFGPWYNTQMEFEREYTHGVDLEITRWWIDDQKLSFDAVIKDPYNHDYIDNYDIYVVPNQYTSIKDAGFKTHLESGHEDALFLDPAKYSTEIKVAPRTSHHNTMITRHIPYSDLPAGSDPTPGNRNYTLFLKAKYNTPETLAGTFHALASPSLQLPTNINDVMTDGYLDVKVNGKEVTISGSDGNVMIVSASGMTVYQGGDNTVALGTGMYIVRSKDNVKKILVK